MFRFLSNLIDSSLEILFSPSCPICKSPTFKVGVCEGCNPIRLIEGKICERCGIPVSVNLDFCGQCMDRTNQPLDRTRSALWLTEPARLLIHKIKFQKGYEWLNIFKNFLKEVPFPYLEDQLTLMPVPLHRSKFLKRGFNQSEILIEYLEQARAYEVSYGLKKVRETLPQSALGRVERRVNLSEAFRWKSSRPVPRNVVLVDDIMTTGATLNACASELKKWGAKRVYGWTLFRSK